MRWAKGWGGGGGGWEWRLFDDFYPLILYKVPYFHECVLLINQPREEGVGEGGGEGNAFQRVVRA